MDSASAKQCMPASIVALFPTSQPKHSLFHSTRSLTLLRFNLYINWIFDVPFVALSVLLHVWVRVCVCGFFLFCSSDIPWHLPFCARRAQHLKCNNNNNKSENKHKQQRQQQQQKCAGYEQWEIASHFATPKRSSKAGLSLLILCSACTLPSLPWNECIA